MHGLGLPALLVPSGKVTYHSTAAVRLPVRDRLRPGRTLGFEQLVR